jgi:hypothetical protein
VDVLAPRLRLLRIHSMSVAAHQAG